MRFAFVARHRPIWPVNWLCEVLKVSRSGFHAWLNRPTSIRGIDDAKLVTATETSFKASDQTCGAHRVWRDGLEGFACRLHLTRTTDADQCPEGAAQTPWQAQGRWGTVGDRRHRAGERHRFERTREAWTGISRPTSRTRSAVSWFACKPLPGNSWPTLPAYGPPRAGYMSRSCWTCSPGGQLAGP